MQLSRRQQPTSANAIASIGGTAALGRTVLRQLPMLAILGVLAWLMRDRIAALDLAQVRRQLGTVGPLQWALGGLLTAVSFWALGQYDILAHRLVGRATRRTRAARSGMISIALGQTLGMGAITGALVRWRLLPELSLVDATKISALVSLSFLAAWAVVAAAAVLTFGVALPHAGWLAVAVLSAAVALVALSLWRPGPIARLPLPSLKALALLLAFTAIDTAAAAGVLWAMLPEGIEIGLGVLTAAYLLALGAGLVMTSPGGVGAFEMALIALLPQVPAEPLLAAVLAYRAVYYALPAVIAGALLARRPQHAHATEARATGLARLPRGHLPMTVEAALNTAPRAEAALLRHGRFDLLQTGRGRPLALAARSGQSLIQLGDGLPRHADPRTTLTALSDAATLSLRAPVLYKSGARLAAMARRNGWKTLRMAEEAYLDPQSFTEDGAARRQLRRKLRKAEAAGLTLTLSSPYDPLPLPVGEMAALASAWAETHGGERGFSMGVWDPATLPDALVITARDEAGKLVAFATFHLNRNEMTLDLMRQGDAAPDGTMHLIVTRALAAARDMGLPRLSLAAVPASPPEGEKGLAARLRRALDSATGAEGLRQFKSAFAPAWEPLYMAAPTRLALALGAIDLAREITRKATDS